MLQQTTEKPSMMMNGVDVTASHVPVYDTEPNSLPVDVLMALQRYLAACGYPSSSPGLGRASRLTSGRDASRGRTTRATTSLRTRCRSRSRSRCGGTRAHPRRRSEMARPFAIPSLPSAARWQHRQDRRWGM